MSDKCAWNEAPRNDCHKELSQFVEYVRLQQQELRENARLYRDLYSRGNVTGLGFETSSNYFWGREGKDGQPIVAFNLASAAVDTAYSLIGQAPSIPMYVTTGGDFKLIRQAEKCTEILQGQFNDPVKEVCKRAELDALKVGTGFVFQKFDPITGLPGIERELLENVHVEFMDGFYGTPCMMARTRIVPKRTLAQQMPKFKHEIMDAPGVSRNTQVDLFLSGLGAGWSYDDFVEVQEAWYLRPTAKTKGRHVMCISTATLFDRPYMHDDFPCSVYRYRERDVGYYGAGLIESCQPHQDRIDTLIQKIARTQDLMSNIIVLNPNGEGAVKNAKLTNDIGLVINYEPLIGPPTIAKWEGTLNDLQNQVDLEVSRFMMSEGISESQANGMGAGRGLDSGVAVRAADDVQSRRLVPYVTRYQVSQLHTARLFERMNDDMAKKDENYTVMVEGGGDGMSARRFLKTARWMEVRPPKGDARLNMAQMSALPTTPQGRFAAVQEYIQAGFVNRQYAQKLLQAPDLDNYANIELAHVDIARWQIEELLDGKAPMPDPRQDLEMVKDLMVKSKLRAMTLNADEDTVQAFEDFIVYTEELLDMAAAQANAAAAPAPVPGMPAGPGGPVPPMGPGMPPGAPLPTQVMAPGLGQGQMAA